MSEPTKFLLGEEQIPTHWINLLSDLHQRLNVQPHRPGQRCRALIEIRQRIDLRQVRHAHIATAGK